MTPQATEPILFHDGTWKGDAMRQALIDANQSYQERPTGRADTAVVIHNGNCYYCPDTVRSMLVPQLLNGRR